LQAVIGDDPLDTANAQEVMGLLESLRDDFRRSVRVQEAVPDDLAHDLVGAAVIGLGAGGFALQRWGAVVLVEMEQLEVTGFGIAEFGGGLGRARAFALAFEEHGQFEGDLIAIGDEQGAGGAGEVRLMLVVERNHGGEGKAGGVEVK